MRSPIYRHPGVYRAVLRALYGGELDARFAEVKKWLPQEGTVLDVCAGDGAIARELPRGVRYLAVDGNDAFVNAMKKRGLEATLMDVRHGELPRADTVLMMGSLYHFFPEQRRMITKLLASATKRLIVVEPHVNWSSRGGVLGWLSQRLTDPGIAGSHLGRLSAHDLDTLAAQTLATHVVRMEREYILVWAHGP